MNQRFFIALLPPDPIQDEVRQIQYDFRDRYNTKAALKSPPHITLIPPFELSSDRLESLQIELEKFCKPRSSFAIAMSRFAAFPPRVIYINVKPNPILQNLYLDTAELTKNFGIVNPYAFRPFVPHMTVGFRDLTTEKFNMAWSEFRDRPIDFNFSVINLTLLNHDEQKWNVHTNFSF